MANSRGSEWRKWDLHMHTPKSIHNNYGGDNDVIWDKYIAALEHLPEDVKVIGITDYYFIDGYEKVMEYRKKGRLKNIQKIFPILEFRIDTFGSGNENTLQKINLHILFDIDESCLYREINKIKTEFIGQIPITRLDRYKTKMLSMENFVLLGGDLQKGFRDFIPPTDKVFELLESSTWKGKTFCFLGYKEWSNLEKNNQLKPLKKDLYEHVGAFFSSNYDTIRKNQNWLNEYGKKRLLHSLDIHDFDLLDTANIDTNDVYQNSHKYCCYTWIKADTTFEGLKQILFEPDERVCVQLEKPDYKAPFRVIDSISLDEKSFWNDTIYLNGNLNTIIGGRSTGKSTLLNAIARKLDCPIEKLTQKDGYNDYIEEHFSGVSIHWSDGQEDNTRDVDYYPQSYMYQIANDGKKLDRIICDNIMEDKKDAISKYIKNNNQLETDLHTTILSLFQEQEKYKALSSQLREKGNKSAISKEIGDLEIKVKSLTDQTQITEAEIERYKADTETLSQIEQKNNAIHRDITTLESLINTPILASNFPQKYDVLSENTREHLIKVYSNIAETANEQWVNQIKEILQTLHTEQGNNEQQYNTIKNTPLYIKCKQYYDNNKELNSIQTRLREEQKKLHEFEEQETICNKCKQEIDNLVKKIVDQYIQFQTNTNAVCRELSIKRNDLTIAAHTIFLRDDLYDFLKERFIIRSTEQQNYIEKLANEYAEQGTIEDYIRKALNSEIVYKSTHHAQEVMTALLSQNWYKYQFDVIYQDDKFTEMSQGKQAFVVLKLLLDFSKKQCPILIDQPEDSLDNRAIYKDLVEYIRNKKKERQIILVTHNPNVVVSADAENVIVANQNGNNSPNQNGVKFHYINGSLENSKDKNACVGSILESQGIREHVCEILEGGKEAFEKREKKYGFR